MRFFFRWDYPKLDFDVIRPRVVVIEKEVQEDFGEEREKSLPFCDDELRKWKYTFTDSSADGDCCCDDAEMLIGAKEQQLVTA